MAMITIVRQFILLIGLFATTVIQQGILQVGSPITSIEPPGMTDQSICTTSAGIIYFKKTPFMANFIKTGIDVEISIVGTVQSIKCSGSIVAIHTMVPQTGSYRLYIYDVGSTFNKQNYISWPTKDFSIQSIADRAALVLLPQSDTSGIITLSILPLNTSIVSSANIKQLSLTITTNNAMMGIVSNLGRIIVVSDDITRSALSIVYSLTYDLTLEGNFLNFPTAVNQVLTFRNIFNMTSEHDSVYAVTATSIHKYLVKPNLSKSGLDGKSLTYEYTSDQIIITETTNFENSSFILALHTSGIARILDTNLQTLNYIEDTGLAQASYLAAQQTTASSLNIYTSYINKSTPSTFDIESHTFATCPSNCATCLSSTKCYLNCTAGHYLLSDIEGFGICYAQNRIPAGYGVNGSNSMLAVCYDTNCIRCEADYRMCRLCNATDANGNPASYYLRNDSVVNQGQQCLLYMPNFYGLDLTQTSGNLIKGCQVVSCVSCESDYLSCSRCQSPLLSYTASNGNTTCIEKTSIPAGWGINDTNLFKIAACADTNCANCPSNISSCLQCSIALGMWLKISSLGSICVDPNIPQSYFGKNSGNSSLVPCADANCKNCMVDSSQCQACRPPSEAAGQVYFIGSLAGISKCLLQRDIPAGLFVDSGASAFSECLIGGCSSCSTAATECSKCAQGLYLYQNSSGVKCFSVHQVMEFTGEDRKRGVNGTKFVQCGVKCLECFNSYLVCSRCEANFALFGNATSKSCTNISNLPDGYGINSTSGQIEQCIDPLCLQCKSNNSQCTTCSLSSYFYYINETSTPQIVRCARAGVIPQGYGRDLNSSQLLLRRCSYYGSHDQYCIECSANYEKCTNCVAGYYIQPFMSNIKARCVLNSQITHGYGLNLTLNSSLLVLCETLGCSDCFSNYSRCQACNTGLYLDSILNRKAKTTTCQSIASMAIDIDYVGAGVDNSSMTVQPCFSGCLNCTYDYLGCSMCNSSLYLLKNDSSRSCEMSTFVITNEGFGLSTSGHQLQTIQKCSVSQCALCPSDFTSCEACKVGYYLYQPQNTSALKQCSGPTLTDFPDFFGIIPSASPPRIDLCTIAGCSKIGCKSNNSFCRSCSIGFEIQYVSQYVNYCVNSSASVPDGYGRDLENSGTIKVCALADLYCSKCPNNYQLCEECSSPLLLNTTSPSNPSGLCLSDTTIDGLGKVANNSKILNTCKVDNCIECYVNYELCNTCDTGFLLDKVTLPGSSRCIDDSQIVPGTGKNGTGIALCSIIGCSDCQADYSSCQRCQSCFIYNPDMIESLPACLPYDDLPAGYGADGNSYIRQCLDTLCMTCSVYDSCTRCDNGYFLNSSQNCEQCPLGCLECLNGSFCLNCSNGYLLDNFTSSVTQFCRVDTPNGYGKDPLISVLKPCGDTNCQICGDYFRNCTTCADPFKPVLQPSGLTICASIKNEIQGYGWDSTSLIYKPCEIANCKRCWLYFTACTNCSDFSTQNYYLLVDMNSTSCLEKGSIASGTGIYQVEMTIKNCSLINCSSCLENYLNCTKCSVNFSLQIDPDSSQKCIAGPAEGYGLDRRSGNAVACDNLYCKNCTTDFNTCQNCYYGYISMWQSTAYTLKCQQLTLNQPQGPDLEVINTTTGATTPKLRPCIDSERCGDCSLNYFSCQRCKPEFRYYRVDSPSLNFSHVFTKYYQNVSFYHCMGPSDPWPYAYGADSATESKEIKPCQSGCLSCLANYTICDKCPITGLITVLGNCVNQTMASNLEGQGIDRWLSNGTIKSEKLRACQDSNCMNCTYWNAQCIQCTEGYYLNTTSKTCMSPSSLASASHGPDISSPYKPIESCSSSRCLNCNQDHNKCLACQSQYLYYANLSTSVVKCMTRDELVASKQKIGPSNAGSKELVDCSSGCQTCFNLFTTCEACEDKSHYLIPDGSPSNCMPIEDVPDVAGSGLNITARTVVQCNETNCRNCRFNYQVCRECKIGFMLYPKNSDKDTACLDTSEVSEGTGRVVGSIPEYIEDCQIQGCKSCAVNNMICNACKHTHFSQLYSNGSVEICHESSATIPSTFGIKENTNILQKCQEGCLICRENYLQCHKCLQSWYQFNSTCYQESGTPPQGYGKDKTGIAYKYTPCLAENNCELCSEYFRVCTVCKTNYIFNETQQCTQVTIGTPGYGKRGSDLVPCSIYSCNNCTDDHAICQSCKPGYFGLFNMTVITECLDVLHIPAGFGETEDGQLIPCQVENCEFCSSDAYKCEYCKNHNYLLETVNHTSCLSKDQIPSGLGVSGYKLSSCTETSCNNCSTDIDFCTTCSVGFYLERLKTGRKCTNHSEVVNATEISSSVSNDGLQSQETDSNTGDSLLKFSVSIANIKKTDLIFRAYNPKTGKVYGDMSVKEFNVLSRGHSLTIRFNFSNSITNAHVYIFSKTSTLDMQSTSNSISEHRLLQTAVTATSNPFDKGILVKDVSYYEASTGWLKKSGLGLSIAIMIVSGLSFMRWPIACYKIIEVSIFIGMFNLWSSNSPKVTTEFSYWFRRSLFNVIPFFRVDEDSIECTASGPIFFQDYSCFVYNNLAGFIPTFFAWLSLAAFLNYISNLSAFNRIASLSTKLDYEVNNREHTRKTVVSNMLNYSLTVVFPFFYFATVNLYYMNTSIAMKYGFVLALVIIGYYIAIISFGISYLRKLRGNPSKDDNDLLMCLADGLRLVDKNRSFVKYIRVIEIARNALLGMALALLNEYKLAQSLVAVFIISPLFFVLYFTKAYESDALRRYISVKEFLFIGESILLCITASDKLSAETRQESLGFVQVAIILSIALASIYFGLQLIFIRPPSKSNDK